MKPWHWYFISAGLFAIAMIGTLLAENFALAGLWLALGAVMLAAGLRTRNRLS